MDYSDFCLRIVRVIADAEDADSQSQYLGIDVETILEALFGKGDTLDAEFMDSSGVQSFLMAYPELEKAGLLQTPRHTHSLQATRSGRSVVRDSLPHWRSICQQELEADEISFLRELNRRSQASLDNHAIVSWVRYEELIEALGWMPVETGIDRMERVMTGLREIGFADWPPYLNSDREARSTYQGLVWDTRRDQVFMWDTIDQLVREWETNTVDFKRELRLKTKDQKAEFIKDVIGLANTKASGGRWLIVGFDNTTREYHVPNDPAAQKEHSKGLASLTSETLDQILSEYTEQPVRTALSTVQYRQGPVVMIQVLRDPQTVPHRVKKQCAGAKKKVSVGEIYVRHGSITEAPSPDELQALFDEAERSKSTPL